MADIFIDLIIPSFVNDCRIIIEELLINPRRKRQSTIRHRRTNKRTTKKTPSPARHQLYHVEGGKGPAFYARFCPACADTVGKAVGATVTKLRSDRGKRRNISRCELCGK